MKNALFHYRMNFMIYIVTCLFSMTQVMQGSLFFSAVAVLTFILTVLLGIIVVRLVIEEDIKDMEEEAAEEAQTEAEKE